MPAKPYKTVKKAAKSKATATKREVKGTAKTYKKGVKSVKKGVAQRSRAIKAQSKETGQPSQRNRYRKMDADVKIREGNKAMANPKPKAKIKKKAYRTAPAAGHGPGKYVTRKGTVVSRKKRR